MDPVYPTIFQAGPTFIGRVGPVLPSLNSVVAMEKIHGYSFRDKRLLEKALIHSSFFSDATASYQRLEFLGDTMLGLAVSNHVFLAYPGLDPEQLSLLQSANINIEKLACIAVRHGLYHYVHRKCPYA